MDQGIGPKFEAVANDGVCEAIRCSRAAMYHAVWPWIFKRVCTHHKDGVARETLE